MSATAIPTSWARTNQRAESGEIEEGESEKTRPIVTAGFAKEVEEVKMWPANIHAATEAAIRCDFSNCTKSRIKRTSPNVATTSPKKVPAENLPVALISSQGTSNMRFASTAPEIAPTTCEAM